nr:ribonuclease H-like domain-containing protein [Tanacetum cinerariifolium]
MSVQDVNHLNFFNTNTLDDFPDILNDKERRNPNPIRHGNSPSHSGSPSASLSRNDAGHSQDVDVSASENGSFAACEENNNNSEGSGLHDQTQEDVSQDIVDLPIGRIAIGSKWDWKIKYKSDGDIERYKARLVTQVSVDDIIITGNSLAEIEKPNISLSSEPNDTDPLLDNITEYQKLIGKLIYLTTTRPDIAAYTVSCLSQFMHNPLRSHPRTALKVIRYLKGSLDKGINVIKGSASGIGLKAYSNAYWERCTNTRRSITGYCMFMCESLVSEKSKKQNTISKSSTESEYIALAFVTSEVTWILKILKDLKYSNLLPMKAFCDSNSTIKIAANPVFHERTKQLEIDLYFVREKIIARVIETVKIEIVNQIADILTKVLDTKQHNFLCYKLGRIDMFQNKIKRWC